jgi:hypothetical protein
MIRPKWVKLALMGIVGVPAAVGLQALPAVGQSSPSVAAIRLGSGRIAARGAGGFCQRAHCLSGRGPSQCQRSTDRTIGQRHRPRLRLCFTDLQWQYPRRHRSCDPANQAVGTRHRLRPGEYLPLRRRQL